MQTRAKKHLTEYLNRIHAGYVYSGKLAETIGSEMEK